MNNHNLFYLLNIAVILHVILCANFAILFSEYNLDLSQQVLSTIIVAQRVSSYHLYGLLAKMSTQKYQIN